MLCDKVAIVTGANRGIGNAISKIYLEHGATVYCVARSQTSMDFSIEQWKKEIGDEIEKKVHVVVLDIRNSKEIKRVLMDIYKSEGHIDILVNNAGVMKDALIGMITDELMQEIFETNVYGLINMSQLTSRFMSKNKYGKIINLASIIGTNGNAGQSVYSASKGAVISFTKSAAKELANKGITVNAIAPGIIDTELLNNVPKDELNKRVEQIKLGRIGTVEDVAKVALFLASDLSGYVSGQILGVDGCTVM